MSFLRSSSIIRPSVLASTYRPVPRAIPAIGRRFASGDYGSGSGDPVGENPQKQGKNPQEHMEHPGPPPPKAGQSGSSSESSSGSQTSQSSQQQTSNSGATSKSNENSRSTRGAQPKILSENPPTDDANEDVKKHNEELRNRSDHPRMGVSNEDSEKDKVPPSFWSGQGGADRQP